jgi:adenosylcobinamide-GDP ribazoletransferase
MNDWLDDLRLAVAMLTRIPMPHPDGATPPYLARMQRAFPLVGATIGAAVGLLFLGLLATGMPALAAAALALGASALLTGAFHEDGLADLADGFGGGRDKAAKLEIMRDSRLGTYGTLALVVVFVAKTSALTGLPKASVLTSLIAVHALSRGPLPILALALPYARDDGLAASRGQVDAVIAATAAAIAIVIAFLCLPFFEALLAVIVAAFAMIAIGVIAKRQIGGQTGDVLGGAQQVAEVAILLLLSIRFAP